MVTRFDVASEVGPLGVRLFADLGYTPVVLDITEFQKLEGRVTCLSVRLRDR
jgi:dimethylargininase